MSDTPPDGPARLGLFDASRAEPPWAVLAELRRTGPVVAIEGGMRYVTTYEACRAVLRDTDAFSNANGFKAPGVEIPVDERILGELDPPRHTAVRRVMVTALTPKVVHGAAAFIRETADALLATVPVPGEADLVARFTVPLPNRVTVHLLGLPAEDADQIAAWATELMESGFPATNRTDRGEGFAGAFPAFAGYIDEQIRRRADQRGDGPPRDVLGRLLHLEIDGVRLDATQVRALVRNLITGGLTTTSQLLGNLLYQLLTVAGLDAAVRADDGHLAPAIEESLRVTPPVLFVPRGCQRDTTVGDTAVHRGERVIVGTASANRDEQVFVAGEDFRVDRGNADQHLTFGYGPHVCPGATLARAVARIGIQAFLDRFPAGSVRLAAGYTYEHVPTFFECGPARLPVDTTSV
ncbi:MAG TPA: cytochrome P450 [Acidimicrobiia bacterium]|nr:cytochrome P450 [Acidimicrobiia bacterium]